MPTTGAAAAVHLDDDADPEGAHAEWTRWRRRQRLADLHWVDALYQAYLAALLVGIAIVGGASIVGDEPVRATAALADDGEALLSLVVAFAAGVGLRSGSRGGPLAVDHADVRHVLLAPVDRVTALRGPAARQLRFLLFGAGVVGAVAGHLADRRLDGNGAAWTACAVVAAMTTLALGYGCACWAAGLRLRPWLATGIALVLVGTAAADVAGRLSWSPGAVVGGIALWPIRVRPAEVVAVVVVGALAVAGLRLVAGVSVEQLERRSRLVGQLRFAATVQDLRTVVVLHRQLSQERSRTKPWLRPPLPRRALPVLVRDVRSLLLWPAGRAARLALLAVVAGVCGRAAYDGTTPLVAVAGLALFVAGLDAAEPLGQELDHPTRRDSVPLAAGSIHVRHLPAVVAVALGVATASAVVGVLVDPTDGAWPVALACVPAAGIGAALGAVVNLVMGSTPPAATAASTTWMAAPPEAAGVRIVFRTAWPPSIAVGGAAAVLAAREQGAEGALLVAGALVALGVLVAGWVRFRDDISAFFATRMQAARPS